MSKSSTPSKQYSRKEFLKKGSLIASAGLTLGIASCKSEENEDITAPNIITNKKYKWKCVTTWPPNFPVVGEGAILLADWIREMSGGRLDIKVYGGGELVPALEVWDAVVNGAAEMGTGRDLYAKYNLVPFAGGNTGVQMGGWYNKEINSIADYKGLKMRIPGLGAKVLEKAGGTPVLSAGSEIYTNLERGVIDATEWIGPYHDYKMGFHQIAKYYYSPGWHEPGSNLEVMVNKRDYDKLDSDLRAIIDAASAKLNMWTLGDWMVRWLDG